MFWVLDRLACNPIKDVFGFYPQLHAVWHVLIFGAAWYTTVFMFYITANEEQAFARISPVLYGTVYACEVV